MRVLIVLSMVLAGIIPAGAGEAPIVEQYLHAGNYQQGEQDLMVALTLESDDDQLRFGLGVLQFVHGIEQLGQSLRFRSFSPADSASLCFSCT